MFQTKSSKNEHCWNQVFEIIKAAFHIKPARNQTKLKRDNSSSVNQSKHCRITRNVFLTEIASEKKRRSNTFRNEFGLWPLVRSSWAVHRSSAWKTSFWQSDKMRFHVVLDLKDFRPSFKSLVFFSMWSERNSHLEAVISCRSSCLFAQWFSFLCTVRTSFLDYHIRNKLDIWF